MRVHTESTREGLVRRHACVDRDILERSFQSTPIKPSAFHRPVRWREKIIHAEHPVFLWLILYETSLFFPQSHRFYVYFPTIYKRRAQHAIVAVGKGHDRSFLPTRVALPTFPVRVGLHTSWCSARRYPIELLVQTLETVWLFLQSIVVRYPSPSSPAATRARTMTFPGGPTSPMRGRRVAHGNRTRNASIGSSNRCAAASPNRPRPTREMHAISLLVSAVSAYGCQCDLWRIVCRWGERQATFFVRVGAATLRDGGDGLVSSMRRFTSRRANRRAPPASSVVQPARTDRNATQRCMRLSHLFLARGVGYCLGYFIPRALRNVPKKGGRVCFLNSSTRRP